MKNIFYTLAFFSVSLCNFNYSALDNNTTSPTYGLNVWSPEYDNHIVFSFFSDQGWAGWTLAFGQLSDFQSELINDYGFENIVFIAVGRDIFNAGTTNNFCSNSDLPLVIDTSPDYPIRAQFSPYSGHKSLTATGYDGEFLANISLNSLSNSVKNQIIDILNEHYQDTISGDVNSDELVNVQDIVLVVNLVLSNTFDSDADINNDGLVNVLDVVQVVNIILN